MNYLMRNCAGNARRVEHKEGQHGGTCILASGGSTPVDVIQVLGPSSLRREPIHCGYTHSEGRGIGGIPRSHFSLFTL